MNAGALASIWQKLVAAARTIAGVPDYDAYVAHLRGRHPDRPIPTQSAFFADRQTARYRSGGRCC
ncbi:MAG TPA: YbdD/YjiX family protein [Rhodanobacteraceae bacterium]